MPLLQSWVHCSAALSLRGSIGVGSVLLDVLDYNCGHSDSIAVLLDQLASWQCRGNRHVLLLQAKQGCEACGSYLERNALAARSRGRGSHDRLAHLLHPRAAVWWADASLEEQHCYRPFCWLHPPPSCVRCLGAVPEGVRHDCASYCESSPLPVHRHCCNCPDKIP